MKSKRMMGKYGLWYTGSIHGIYEILHLFLRNTGHEWELKDLNPWFVVEPRPMPFQGPNPLQKKRANEDLKCVIGQNQ